MQCAAAVFEPPAPSRRGATCQFGIAPTTILKAMHEMATREKEKILEELRRRLRVKSSWMLCATDLVSKIAHRYSWRWGYEDWDFEMVIAHLKRDRNCSVVLDFLERKVEASQVMI